MPRLAEKKKCTGCFACVNSCNFGALTICEDNEGFLYPMCNPDVCVECGVCGKVCPEFETPVCSGVLEAYCGHSLSTADRERSSSGGIFLALSRFLIRKGYLIAAAKYEGDRVVHCVCSDAGELEKFAGSKYVQSDISSCIERIGALLKSGMKVAVFGTPCQINGVRNRFRNNENLLLIDFVCHGVPSPKLFKKYLLEMEKRFESEINDVNMRDKTSGWHRYSIKITFNNNTVTIADHAEDDFFKIYASNYPLRPSCYSCRHRGVNRASSLTMGDFWGIGGSFVQDDDRGTSIILANDKKGCTLLRVCSGCLELHSLSLEDAVRNNPSYSASAKRPMKRRSFFKEMNRLTVKELASKYAKLSFPRRALRICRHRIRSFRR